MASSSISTILIIGGSGGIGESFARRFHSQGKHVIVTGRNKSRLDSLASSCAGLSTYVMDNTDLSSLPGHISTLTQKYPKIDTVWINGGIQHAFKMGDLDSHTDAKVVNEITTNVMAPVIIARHVIPFLKSQPNKTTFMITSSGLAFVPMSTYPVYCPTKAFIHHFMVGLRQEMKGSNINIIEIAPPKVATELEADHKDASSKMPAMSLQEYTDKTFEILDGQQGELKEVAVGFAQNGVDAWRGSIGGILEGMGMGG